MADLDLAAEARRFYAADGTFVEMDPVEVKIRRIAAAQDILDLQARLQRLVARERDQLAAMAMQGIAAGWQLGGEDPAGRIRGLARNAYAVADAMLAEREKGGGRAG